MVPVLVDEVVIVLVGLHPQPRAALLPLIPEVGVIEVRTVRSRQTLSTDHEKIRYDFMIIRATDLWIVSWMSMFV